MLRWRRPVPWLSIVLFLLNAGVAWRLFRTEYLAEMGTPEGAFIAYARYAGGHWNDLGWLRFWYAGIPFQNAYPPGLHLAVAAVSRLAHLSAAPAFHIVEATMYSLGPVTLFWMACRLTRAVGWSFAAGALYSLVSPSAWLVAEIRHDLGSPFWAQRLHTPVAYGDGPHMASLTLIPLAILALDLAVRRGRPVDYIAAALALAAVPLTNWPGAIVCAFAVIAYGLSLDGVGRSKRWIVIAAAGVLGYAVAMPWIPPSAVIATEKGAESFLPVNRFAPRHLAYISILSACTWALLRFTARRLPGYLRFFLLLFLYMAAVTLGFYWFGVTLIAQPQRFHLAMEMGCVLSAVFVVRTLIPRWPSRPRSALAAALAFLCVFQWIQYRTYARRLIQPADITRTSEYKTARWFDAHLRDRRVMVAGSETFWLNAFTDTPQLAGCCPQGLATQTIPVASYGINTDLTAEDRAFENSVLWFKALGVRAVAVPGPRSTEVFKPFYHPEKFAGRLPVLWRDGDDVIYGVPVTHDSLAHAVDPRDLVARPPAHGVDTAPLVNYVAAIERDDAPLLASRWTDDRTMLISGKVPAGQVVSVQVSGYPGWHARVDGSPRPVRFDSLGFLVVEPDCRGDCSIELAYDGGAEMAAARWISRTAIAGSAAWIVLAFLRRRRAPTRSQ